MCEHEFITEIIENIANRSKKRVSRQLHDIIKYIIDTDNYTIFDSYMNSFIITKKIELPFKYHSDLVSLLSLSKTTLKYFYNFINVLTTNSKYLKQMCQNIMLLIFDVDLGELYFDVRGKKIPMHKYNDFLNELRQQNYRDGVIVIPDNVGIDRKLVRIAKLLTKNEVVSETFDLIKIMPKFMSLNTYNLRLHVRYKSIDELYHNINNIIKQIELIQKYNKMLETKVFNLLHFVSHSFPFNVDFADIERVLEYTCIVAEIIDSALINKHLDVNYTQELYNFIYYIRNSIIKYDVNDLKTILSNYIIETTI